jgi:hypothetical protein
MFRVVVFTLAVVSMGLAASSGYGADIDRTAVDFTGRPSSRSGAWGPQRPRRPKSADPGLT